MLEVVTNDVGEAGESATEAPKKGAFGKQKEGLQVIMLRTSSVDSSISEKIANATTLYPNKPAMFLKNAKKVQTELKKMRLQIFGRQFELLQMDDKETISDNFTEVIALTNQLKTNGELEIS